MPIEPYPGYMPEINAGRLESGVGPGLWIESGMMWLQFAELAAAAMAAWGAEVAALEANYLGSASAAMVAKSGLMLQYLGEMVAYATVESLDNFAVAMAYSAGRTAMAPLIEVTQNRLDELIAELTNFFGINSGLIAFLNGDYARMWGQNGSTMMTYDGAVTAATAPKPVPPPPFLASAAAAGEGVAEATAKAAAKNAIGAATESATQSFEQGVQGASQGTQAPQQGMEMMGQMTQFAQAPMQAFGQVGQLGQSFTQPLQSLTQPLQSLMGEMGGKTTDAGAFGLNGPEAAAFTGTPLGANSGGGTAFGGGGGGGTGLGGGLGGTMLSQGAYGGSSSGPVKSQQIFSGVSSRPTMDTVTPAVGSMGAGGGMAPAAHGAGGGTTTTSRRTDSILAAADDADNEAEAREALALFR